MKNKDLFNKIINPKNIFDAWDEFKKGKLKKPDVSKFEKYLEKNVFQLHRDLKSKIYKHGPYFDFYIYDPKLRHVHKATVRDRVLHHAIFKTLSNIFEPTFISTSFSCRINKGTHKGVTSIRNMLRTVSRNNTLPCYALKCDIKKFFDSIDHSILLSILKRKIKDKDTIWLLEEVIAGFIGTSSNLFIRKGIPIGNLTSQLFANVYMNKFDHFMKHTLKIKNYARYTDDFIVISNNEEYLQSLLPQIEDFLTKSLALSLHPEKVIIKKYTQGIDFLGYVIFPQHVLLRKKTEKRIFRKLKYKIDEHKGGLILRDSLDQSLNSYIGVLSHADAYKKTKELKNQYWYWLHD